MKIGHLDTSKRVVIVAEIGLSHEGDVGAAEEMIHRAAEAGADAVKFQVYNVLLYGDPTDRERYERLARFELPPGAFDDLAAATHNLGLAFIATPFDLESADLCIEICDAMKIASKDLDFWPLLEQVVSGDKPIILSTGMSDQDRVRRIPFIPLVKRGGVALLHCVSAYPVPHAQAELRAITYLAEELPWFEIGYSDHTVGLDAAPLAVALGARIIEKHFTLDHHFSDFRDHELSANPQELAELVRRIRRTEELLGEPIKRVMPCEGDTIEACSRERLFRESVLTR